MDIFFLACRLPVTVSLFFELGRLYGLQMKNGLYLRE